MGRSSMKVGRTILGHLSLLASLAWLRLRGRKGAQTNAEDSQSVEKNLTASRSSEVTSTPSHCQP